MTGGDGWMGYGSSMMNGGMGAYWHPGDGRMFWGGSESYARGLRHDADAVRYGAMSLEEYGSKNGRSISVEQLRYMAYAHNHGVNPVTGVRYTFMTQPSSPRLHVNTLNVAFAKVTLQETVGYCKDCGKYSDGTFGLRPRVSEVVYKPTLTQSWFQFSEDKVKLYYTDDFTKLLVNPINPFSELAYRTYKHDENKLLGFTMGYKGGFDYDPWNEMQYNAYRLLNAMIVKEEGRPDPFFSAWVNGYRAGRYDGENGYERVFIYVGR